MFQQVLLLKNLLHRYIQVSFHYEGNVGSCFCKDAFPGEREVGGNISVAAENMT